MLYSRKGYNVEIYVVGGGMLGANAYLLVEKEGAPGVLIDAGCSISNLNKEVERHADGISAVLLTHGHFDHIASLGKIIENYNPKIYIHKNDASMLNDPKENMSDRYTRKGILLKDADVIVSDGDKLNIEGIEIDVMHTPGHTMGSCIFLADNHAFAGDTLFKGSIGRFDFPHSDFESMIRSLAKIKKELPKDTIVYPGHGQSTTMGVELEKNPHLQF